MNYKRQVIEKWITEDLPRATSEELRRGALAEQAQAQDALQAARQKVLDRWAKTRWMQIATWLKPTAPPRPARNT